jgi:hypothetical protein
VISSISDMYTEIDLKLINDYLIRHYSVSRIKDGNRFKRAIILDDGKVYLLSDKSKHNQIRFGIIETLKDVFNYDNILLISVVNKFLTFL